MKSRTGSPAQEGLCAAVVGAPVIFKWRNNVVWSVSHGETPWRLGESRGKMGWGTKVQSEVLPGLLDK